MLSYVIALWVPSDAMLHDRKVSIQISLRIRAVWSESSLTSFWKVKDAKFLHADKKDPDQAARMLRDWSESSLGAHVRRGDLSSCGTYDKYIYY